MKSGTTSDVYSVNAAAQKAASALGGGGSLNSAYSAVASVPGAYVPANQTGYFQTVSIRGGDYDQVGYEFDGVPVNRSFDNYPSSSASSLGNAEVQVYTGANPANSEGQGLSGYINQVIKTGTYPGYATGELGIGTPAYLPSRDGGSRRRDARSPVLVLRRRRGVTTRTSTTSTTRTVRVYDNFAGAPMSLCTGSCPNIPGGNTIPYAPTVNGLGGLAPVVLLHGAVQLRGISSNLSSALSSLAARDAVVNFHVGIPHKYDAGKDDVQLLWDSESLHNDFYSTTNDITSTAGCSGGITGAQCADNIGLGAPVYIDSLTWTCPSVGRSHVYRVRRSPVKRAA